MKDSSYNPGDWNSTCYRCGIKFKASQLRKTWQGFYVCDKDWEPRHPQDFVKSVPDNPGVPWVQHVNWAYVGPDFATLLIAENYGFLMTEDGLFIQVE
jgi:hypothetical protein